MSATKSHLMCVTMSCSPHVAGHDGLPPFLFSFPGPTRYRRELALHIENGKERRYFSRKYYMVNSRLIY